MFFQELMDTVYFENPLLSYITFGGIFLFGLLFKQLISRYLGGILFKLLGKSAHEVGRSVFDDRLKKPLNSLILFGALFFASQQLQFPTSWGLASIDEIGTRYLLHKGFSLVYAYFIFLLLLRIVDFIGEIMKRRAAKTSNKMDDQIVPFAIEIAKVLVIILVSLTSHKFSLDLF